MEAKSIFASKTFWANVIVIVASVVGSPELAGIIPAAWMPFIAPVLGVLNIALRMVTDKPVKIGV